MNIKLKTVLASLCFVSTQLVYGQGFINLGFEMAHVSGTGPIPIGTAMPGWTAYEGISEAGTYSGTVPLTSVFYNWLSTGGPGISVIDGKLGITPLQGNYSVFLFGANDGASSISTTISQTGTVPLGTESLQIEIGNNSIDQAPFAISLGGQTLNMVPLQAYSTYTLYGCNISDAGQLANLNVTALPSPSGGTPSMLLLDNITFSQFAVVPEPGTWVLIGTGMAMVVLFRRRNGSA